MSKIESNSIWGIGKYLAFGCMERVPSIDANIIRVRESCWRGILMLKLILLIKRPDKNVLYCNWPQLNLITITPTFPVSALNQLQIFTSEVNTSTLKRYDVVIVFIILATLNKAVNLQADDCAGAYGSRRENPITFVSPPLAPRLTTSPAFNGIKNQFPAQITQSRQIANASSL